jgi:hypothetical protein
MRSIALVLALASASCVRHGSGPTFGSRPVHNTRLAGGLLIGIGALITVAAATGNLDDSEQGVGNSTEARVGVTVLGAGMIGLGVYMW